MIITIDMDKFLQALKIEGTDEYREAFISVGEFQKALKIAEVKQSGWISVEERLPEQSGRYLTHCNIEGQSLVCVLYYCKIGGFNEGTVTHWMPIPEAPKGA